MPELPDVELYVHALRPRMVGQTIRAVRLSAPFLLRSVEPPLPSVEGRPVVGVSRLGKRIVVETAGELFLVIHLMIAGRFRWKPPGTKVPGKVGLLAIDFDAGTLILTEAGSKRRASLHVVQGRDALAQHDPGGLEVLDAGLDAFAEALRRENHTLKRALTDPHVFSGIEFQMFVFILGPITNQILFFTVLSAVGLAAFELLLIYKLYSATKVYARELAKLGASEAQAEAAAVATGLEQDTDDEDDDELSPQRIPA
jgi:hypothetical protein